MSEFRYMDRVRARERAERGLDEPAPHLNALPHTTEPSPMPSPDLSRVLGGSPLGVILRLALLSFLVGAVLHWLDIRPAELLYWAEDFLRRIWAFGFDGLRDALGYMMVGAMIVVPLWLLSRLFGGRRA